MSKRSDLRLRCCIFNVSIMYHPYPDIAGVLSQMHALTDQTRERNWIFGSQILVDQASVSLCEA